MKLTKEDYMRLKKERLAELLVELTSGPNLVSIPVIPNEEPLRWCDGTICTNPQMDCIGCPRTSIGKVYISPNTATGTSTLKAEGK